MNTELLKLRILVAVKDLILFAKVQFLLVPSPPLLARAPSLRLLWRRRWWYITPMMSRNDVVLIALF